MYRGPLTGPKHARGAAMRGRWRWIGFAVMAVLLVTAASAETFPPGFSKTSLLDIFDLPGPESISFAPNGDLWIAMAGFHQIWVADLDGGVVGPAVGSSREGVANGDLVAAELAHRRNDDPHGLHPCSPGPCFGAPFRRTRPPPDLAPSHWGQAMSSAFPAASGTA